jgi:integrase
VRKERGPKPAAGRPPRRGSPPAAAPPRAPLLPLPPAGQDELDPGLLELVRRYTATLPAPRTRVEYGKALRDFLERTGIRTLGALLLATSHQVTEYRNRLQARGLSPATIKVRLSAVSGMFAALVREGRLPGNPADPRVVRRLPLSEASRTEGLSPEEVRAMIGTCDRSLAGLRDRAILYTLFYEGLRRSEISGLTRRDLTGRKGLLEIRGGKTSSYDAVRLHPEVKRAIEEYHALRNRELGRRDPGPGEPVFGSLSPASHETGPLSPTAVNEIVKVRARLAGIKRPVSAHSMRHACTTAALTAGVPLHQVQRHLRHKDIRTTLRYDRDRDVRKNPTLDLMPPLGG